MDRNRSNIILIGMPGAGKSTVGVILAKRLSLGFIDTDIAIQEHTCCSLQHTVDTEGYERLREIEEEVLCGLDLAGHVIATGGSAVYSARAMEHLKTHGTAVFLQVDLPVLEQRVSDYATRGLAKRPDQGFDDLFSERHGLYDRYADITVASGGMDQEMTCAEVMRRLRERTASAGKDTA